MCERDTFGGGTANPLNASASATGSCGASRRSALRRQRRRPEAEEAVALGGEPLAQPAGRLLHAAVLGEPPRELLGGLLRLELGQLGALLGEQVPRLDLEQRGDQHEELAAGVEVELVARRQVLDERDDDRAMSISAGWSWSLRISVSSRSNGPSNASRSSSRSRTADATRRL